VSFSSGIIEPSVLRGQPHEHREITIDATVFDDVRPVTTTSSDATLEFDD
jgi:hypothetical protein